MLRTMGRSQTQVRVVTLVVATMFFGLVVSVQAPEVARATGFARSENIALVPNASGRQSGGGVFPTSGFPDGYAPAFSDVPIEDVRDAAIDPIGGNYDTVVLNSICDIGVFLDDAQFKARIEAFVANGGKLIIWDSECPSTDYSQFALPFETNNPGQLGAQGVLVDVEENTLSSSDPLSPSYVNVSAVATGTDAVGDANVFTTFDSRWYVDLQATNATGVDGPAQAYANLGSGLVIYSGLDKDFLSGSSSFDPGAADGRTHLNRIWLLDLLQPWDPDGLPNSHPVIGAICNKFDVKYDATVISARGSGDNDTGPSYGGRHGVDLAQGLRDQHALSVDLVGVNYRAVAVPPNPEFSVYAQSVAEGRDVLLYEISKVNRDCGPLHPIVLVGYSQGAHVVQSALEVMDDDPAANPGLSNLAAVAMFASPRFDAGDRGARGTFASNLGGLAGSAPVRARYGDFTRSYCNRGDWVCQDLVFNLKSVGEVHTLSYNPGTSPHRDAIGLAAYGILERFDQVVAANPSGRATGTTAIVQGVRGTIVELSATEIYANGAPSNSFLWDFEGDGVFDQATAEPRASGLVLRSRGLTKQLAPVVWVTFKDGTTAKYEACLDSGCASGSANRGAGGGGW